jgi:hypothetical protein
MFQILRRKLVFMENHFTLYLSGVKLRLLFLQALSLHPPRRSAFDDPDNLNWFKLIEDEA